MWTGIGGQGVQLGAQVLARAAVLEQRQVLQLGYFAGLSSTDIAERLDIPIGTVKSRVAAGLAKLRRSFRSGRAS